MCKSSDLNFEPGDISGSVQRPQCLDPETSILYPETSIFKATDTKCLVQRPQPFNQRTSASKSRDINFYALHLETSILHSRSPGQRSFGCSQKNQISYISQDPNILSNQLLDGVDSGTLRYAWPSLSSVRRADETSAQSFQGIPGGNTALNSTRRNLRRRHTPCHIPVPN